MYLIAFEIIIKFQQQKKDEKKLHNKFYIQFRFYI